MKKGIFLLIILPYFCCQNKSQVNDIKELNTITKVDSIDEKEISKQQRQGCELSYLIRSNSAVNLRILPVEESYYKSRKHKDNNELYHFTNSDSIEKVLQKEYPNIFTKKENKYFFRTKNPEKNIVVWNNPSKFKDGSRYRFESRFKNYIILYEQGYESWSYIIVDTNTGYAYATSGGEPIFIQDHLIMSYNNYYGDFDVGIIDTIENKTVYIQFGIKNDFMEVLSHFYNGNGLYLEVDCHKSEQNKYVYISSP